MSLAALRSAGPLSDPVRVIAIWMLIGALTSAVVLVLSQVALLAEISPARPFLALLALVALLGGSVALPLSIWLVLWPGRTATVLYLRSFRSDLASIEVLSRLRAALGARYRVCGIRPPLERASWWSRLLLTTATGLRYAGSNQFELEAGDVNWLPRVLASCGDAAFVVADVRDITPYVADEIRVGYVALGSERCLFLTDRERTDAEWRTLIAGTLRGTGAEFEHVRYQLLRDEGRDGDGVRRFFDAVRSFLRGLPASRPNLEPAFPLVAAAVAPRFWRTRFWEKDWSQVLAGAALLNLVALAVGQFGSALTILSFVITAAYVVLFIGALRRLWRDERTQARIRAVAGLPRQRWRSWSATALLALWLPAIAAGALGSPILLGARAAANEVSAIASLRAVASAQAAFASVCGDGLYASALEDLARAPSAKSVGFISPDLSANGVLKSGYVVRVGPDAGAATSTSPSSDCAAIAYPRVSSFFAEAHPMTAGTARQKSFAIDARGTIFVRDDGRPIEPGMKGARPLE